MFGFAEHRRGNDTSVREQRSAEYLANVHPLGHVPVLVDGETRVFESGAIVAYLADRFPDKGFAPAPGTPERGQYYQWLSYAATELEPHAALYFAHNVRLPEEPERHVWQSDVGTGMQPWLGDHQVLTIEGHLQTLSTQPGLMHGSSDRMSVRHRPGPSGKRGISCLGIDDESIMGDLDMGWQAARVGIE